MKKILLTGLMALGGLQGVVALADTPADSGSMFKEGRTWRYNAFGTKRHEVGGVSLGVYKVDFDIQAAEETEIDGVKYREFRTTGVSGEYVKYIYSEEDPAERVGSEKVTLDLKPGAPIYMREDNSRIYVRKPSAEPYALRWNVDGNEALVYDLNLTEGQTYNALNLDGDYHEMTLENKGQDLIGGCLPDDEAYVYRYSDSLECLATRNAGFVTNGFLSYAGYSNGDMMDTEPEPVCMPDPRFRIDLWLVIDKDGQLVYEPPMGGVEDVDLDEGTDMRPDADIIYDLNGLRVDRPQRGGVYVRNGKKYIGK